MNSVIAFPAERLRPAAAAGGGRGAEIVIFPGVRIERREFNLADRVAPPRRRRAARARELEAEEA
jgi:hypothetical protein